MSAALWIVIGAGTIISLFTLLAYWVHQGFNEMEDLLEEKAEFKNISYGNVVADPSIWGSALITNKDIAANSITKEQLNTVQETIYVLYNIEYDCLYLKSEAACPFSIEDIYIGEL